MVKFYLMMVKTGEMYLEDVPPMWRADVEWEMEKNDSKKGDNLSA